MGQRVASGEVMPCTISNKVLHVKAARLVEAFGSARGLMRLAVARATSRFAEVSR